MATARFESFRSNNPSPLDPAELFGRPCATALPVKLEPAEGGFYHASTMNDGPIQRMLNQRVVLDTATSIVYIGTLSDVTDSVFVLSDGDMHDCRDGHANKEHYLAEVRRDGVTVNRREVVVMRTVVISLSRLDDIVYE